MKKQHKILFAIAAILALASWGIALYYWDKLPGVIPTHFGFSGRPDEWADKSVFYVFLMPFIQSLILGLFIFLYKKPQYSDMPTTLWLMALDKKSRDHAFGLIRTMLIGTSIWTGLLLTYMTYGMNLSALDNDSSLSPFIILTIVSLMIVWLVFWTLKVYKATKKAMTSTHGR